MTRGREGFALPVALGAIAILALALAGALKTLDDLDSVARQAERGAAFERTAVTAEGRATYLALTARATQDRLRPGGFPIGPGRRLDGGPPGTQADVFLDGRAYAWPALDLQAAFQDEGGLLAVNTSDPAVLARLFCLGGVADSDAQRLADRVADFVDADHEARPLGAERDTYGVAGLPAPPDGPIQRLEELKGVRDWLQIVTPERWTRLQPMLSAHPYRIGVNVDTAAEPVLEAALGLSPAAARKMIADRGVRPFHGGAEPLPSPATQLDDPRLPAGLIRLTLTDRSSGEGVSAQLILTPVDAVRPIWVADRRRFQMPLAPGEDHGLAVFPDPLR